MSAFDSGHEFSVGNILDVILAFIQLLYFGFINIDARHLKTGTDEFHGQGQAHITQADHTDLRGTVFNFLF